ncbi:MAG: hypothetical protein VB948_15825 [Pseudomonadales bacterium]
MKTVVLTPSAIWPTPNPSFELRGSLRTPELLKVVPLAIRLE